MSLRCFGLVSLVAVILSGLSRRVTSPRVGVSRWNTADGVVVLVVVWGIVLAHFSRGVEVAIFETGGCSLRMGWRGPSAGWQSRRRQEARTVPRTGQAVGQNCSLHAPFMELVNASVMGSCAEMVCFKLNAPDGLRAGRKLGAAPEAVAALPVGSFISYHRLSGGTLAGKLV